MTELNVITKDANPSIKIPAGQEVLQVFLNGLLQRRGKDHDYVITSKYNRRVKFNFDITKAGGDWIHVIVN